MLRLDAATVCSALRLSNKESFSLLAQIRVREAHVSVNAAETESIVPNFIDGQLPKRKAKSKVCFA